MGNKLDSACKCGHHHCTSVLCHKRPTSYLEPICPTSSELRLPNPHASQEAQRAAAAAPREVISYIKPNLTISLVDDQTVLVPTNILPQVTCGPGFVTCWL